jgi:FkbM family methyltransferase
MKKLWKNVYLSARDTLWWQRQQKRTKNTPFQYKFLGNDAEQECSFERNQLKMMEKYLDKAQILVDIGANIGYHTCFARNLGKKVIAIEPVTFNLRTLYYNLEINGWSDVEVIPIGLADAPGMATIFGIESAASLINGWAGNNDKWSQRIALNTLDNILGTRFYNRQIMIKIDVEGTELHVIKGAYNTLQRSPKPFWLVEICLVHHIQENHSCVNRHFAEVFNIFWQNGYQAYMVDAGSQKVTEGEINNWAKNGFPGKHPPADWLFLPNVK